MFTIIFIFIILAVLFLAFSSIKLRLKFNESIKFIELSYTLIKFRLLFNDLTGRIYFGGIRIRKFNLLDIFTDKKPKEAIKAKGPREKKKKSVWAKSPNLRQILYYLKKLSYPIRKIKIKYLNIDISDGFSDPFYTGQLYAVYCTAKGIFPKLMSHINFRPDFSADRIKISGEGLVKLRICHILLPILQILADKILGMVRIPFLRIRKGTGYV